MMDYKAKLRKYLNSLFCMKCGKEDLYCRLSCLVFNRHSRLSLAWCDDCERDGKRVVDAQEKD